MRITIELRRKVPHPVGGITCISKAMLLYNGFRYWKMFRLIAAVPVKRCPVAVGKQSYGKGQQ